MSGHGNFSAIDGVRPTLPTIQQPGEDIGVSLNKSVGGVNGPGASDAGGVKEEAPLKETSDAAEKTGALIRQLDVLLARAAESATKGIDAATLKDTLNQVNLAKGDRKAMNAAADKADAAFKAINKFTGFELAAAVSAKDGKFDWNMTNPVGEAIKKALDAQRGARGLARGGDDAVRPPDLRDTDARLPVRRHSRKRSHSGGSGDHRPPQPDA